MSMDFVVRPQSKVDPEEVRARAKQIVQDQRRLKVALLPLIVWKGFMVQVNVIIF